MTVSHGVPPKDRKGLLRAIDALSSLSQRNRTEDLHASLFSL